MTPEEAQARIDALEDRVAQVETLAVRKAVNTVLMIPVLLMCLALILQGSSRAGSLFLDIGRYLPTCG